LVKVGVECLSAPTYGNLAKEVTNLTKQKSAKTRKVWLNKFQ